MEKQFQLGTFIDKLNTSSPLLDGQFRDIIAEGMELLDLTDETCARLFDVSRPTVTRWRNGSTAPVRAMQRLLSDVLKKEATKRKRQRQRSMSRASVKVVAQNR